jgi:phospholipid/cholesterol/gamma-HCH transport system permease protein
MAISVRPHRSSPKPRAPKPPGPAKAFLIEVGEFASFVWQTLVALRRTPSFASEILRQSSILVRGSTLIIAALTVYIGMTQVNFAFFFLRSAGASDYTGLFTGLTTPRAAVPIMFGYVFAAKVGCGLVAEIGAMKINEEIDALESEGINSMSYVVGTRVVGAALFVPIAVVVALLAGTFGSFLQAVPVLQGVSPGGFLHYHWSVQTFSDQVLAFINLGTQAMVIVLVACFYGYRATGGPAAVGAATARSLLVNLVLVHLIAAFYIFAFYGADAKLPIGG